MLSRRARAGVAIVVAAAVAAFAGPPLWAEAMRLLPGALARRLAGETLKLASLCTVISLVLGAPLAWVLRLASARLPAMGLASPVPRLIARFTGLLVVLGEFGLVNLVLRTLRLEAEMPRGGTVGGEMAILGGMVQVFAPFMVLALLKAMTRIDIGTVRALRSLGLSHLRLFWRVAVPLSLGGGAVGVASVFALATGAYVTVAVFGGRRVRALSGLAFEESTELIGWQVAAVAVVVLCVGLVLLARWLGGADHLEPNSRQAAPRTMP